MRFLTIIFFVSFITPAYSQQLRVVGYAKYASIKNGKSLKKDDSLSIYNKVVIQQDGELHLMNKTGWGFYLNKGTYDLDSCYKVYKNIYRDYDSVKAIVDTIFPNGVKGEFLTKGCRTMSIGSNDQDINYKDGNIAFLNTSENDIIKSTADTITIYWADPQKNTGKYVIEFEDMFDDVIGYRMSNGNSLHFNINDFPNGGYKLSFILLTVYSDDGRKSSRVAVQIKQ